MVKLKQYFFSVSGHSSRGFVITYRRGEERVEVINPGKPEVCNLHRPVPGHEDVLGLDVPVDDPVAMKEVHPAEDLPHEVPGLLQRDPGLRDAREILVEVLVHVLEHEVERHLPLPPGPVTDVHQPHDVGVVVAAEVAQQRDLPEDRHRDAVLSQRDPHLLHRHDLTRLPTLGFVDCRVSS